MLFSQIELNYGGYCLEDDDEVMVQDNDREKLLCKVLNLTQMSGRAGHDAEDEMGNKYELKSTTKGGFGTGRDVSPGMIQNWRERYWVCAKGRNLKSGFEIEELYFLSPSMLEDWFSSMLSKFSKDYELREKTLNNQKDQLSQDEIKRLNYLISRGATYNNPHISLSYVRENGIPIQLDKPDKHLRELVRENPI